MSHPIIVCPMDRFILECVQRHDLTASLAAGIVYGTWATSYPEIKPQQKFQPADYTRYTIASRQEVISALVKEQNKFLLKAILLGWIENPKFLKELDLWKEWGVSAKFIHDTIDDYLDLKIASYHWFNTPVFANLMNYIDKKLTRTEAAEWINTLQKKCSTSSPVYSIFTEIIDKHTIH